MSNLPGTLSEATAIRLYHSVTSFPSHPATSINQSHQPIDEDSQEDILAAPSVSQYSTNTLTESRSSDSRACRICRWNRSDLDISACPCLCKGSVGYVHMSCLRRWILQRRSNHCEICHAHFNLPEEKLSFRRMARAFFCMQCSGAILKHLLFGISLLPLAHTVLHQVLLCMEKINQSENEQLSVHEVLVASCCLLTSSALFFHFFEFIATRLLIIRSILRQWWMFGNNSDFEVIELASDSFDSI